MAGLPPPSCIVMRPNNDTEFFKYYGGELLGILFSMALWGISCMQTFLYFFNTPTDSTWVRILVIWLWVFDTAHQCLFVSGLYKTLHEVLPLTVISHVRLEYVVSILFTALVSTAAQLFFTYRIWIFTNKSWVAPGLLGPVILFLFIDAIILMSINLGSTLGEQITIGTISKAIGVAYFAVSMLIDLLIAFLLCWHLWRLYINVGMHFKQTREIIISLILFSTASGIWPAMFAILTLILAIIFPTNYLYAGAYFLLSPIYCNTVLGSINARPYIRDGFRSTIGSTTSTPMDFNVPLDAIRSNTTRSREAKNSSLKIAHGTHISDV